MSDNTFGFLWWLIDNSYLFQGKTGKLKARVFKKIKYLNTFQHVQGEKLKWIMVENLTTGQPINRLSYNVIRSNVDGC